MHVEKKVRYCWAVLLCSLLMGCVAQTGQRLTCPQCNARLGTSLEAISEEDVSPLQRSRLELTAKAATEGELAGVQLAFRVLKSGWGEVAWAHEPAVRIIAAIGTPEAVNALDEVLKDDFFTSGICVLYAIRDSGLAVYRDIVKSSIGASSDGLETEAGLEALGEIGSPADIEFLEEVPGNTKFDYSDDHSNEWADRLHTKAQEAAARIRQRCERK